MALGTFLATNFGICGICIIGSRALCFFFTCSSLANVLATYLAEGILGLLEVLRNELTDLLFRSRVNVRTCGGTFEERCG